MARRQWLGAIPYVVILLFYIGISEYETAQNPDQKLLPSVSRIVDKVYDYSVNPNEEISVPFLDKELSVPFLVADTFTSIRRVLLGISLAGFVGLVLGLSLGLIKTFRHLFGSLVTIAAVIPPITILPIIFMTVGVGERGIILLIFIGTFLQITRDVELAVRAIPREYTTKAATLGATRRQIVFRIFMPLTVPRLLDSIRITLGAAWIFAIVAESVIGEVGLGYRIFLVRRFLGMDVIIPYILWIGLIGFMMDRGIQGLLNWRYRWYANRSRAGA